MNSLHLQSVRTAIYNFRGGFLVRPLAISLCLGLAGGVLPRLEERYFRTNPLRVFDDLQPQLAQSILSAIASGVMTVVSIVFAILLMSLTLASMQFSPRILIGFTRDQVTQWTLGVFLGTFSYCVCAMPSVKLDLTRFVPVVTIEGAMVLALLAVVWLIFFIHHIAHSISVNYIVDRIASETEATIDDMRLESESLLPSIRSRETAQEYSAVCELASLGSGYIRTIDLGRLENLAVGVDGRVEAIRRVGHFVPRGVALLRVYSNGALPNSAPSDFISCFDLGPTRSLQQDVEFGILQIVDIALRAISPAVNDPSTAISCVDQLGRILIHFARQSPAQTEIVDSRGILRVSIPVLGLERLVHTAFDQIRSYGKGDITVNLRMLRALGDLASTVPEPSVRHVLASMGARILASSETRLEEDELMEIRKRKSELDSLAGL